MKPSWLNIIEVVWLVASLYLGSQLSYWLGDSLFERAFAILLAASPVWLSRLLAAVDRRWFVLASAAAIYTVAFIWWSSGWTSWAVRDDRWIAVFCSACFATLLALQYRLRPVVPDA